MSGLPEGYNVRALAEPDLDNGFLDCLAQLTVVGEISPERREETLQYILSRPDTYYIRVITDESGRVVATGTLFVERKFIRNCGSVGHIEDIVVDQGQRGKNLGKAIVTHLAGIAQELGCYKVILDCDKENVVFYEKCEFKDKGAFMAQYF
mmetsp:Transcript_12043/g.12972  ORF Transcript_12043/g.12972 Transcript_12043/m.12972 type:complete len:151 (-) Transcript_12043:80-532(-)